MAENRIVMLVNFGIFTKIINMCEEDSTIPYPGLKFLGLERLSIKNQAFGSHQLIITT